MSEEEEEKNPKKKQAAARAAAAAAALPTKAKAASRTSTASRCAPAAVSTAPPVLFRKAARVTFATSAAIAAERDKGAADEDEAKEEENAADNENDGDGVSRGDSAEEPPALSQHDADRRAANVAALLGGSLAISRKPIAQSLSVAGAEAVLRSAFCSPVPGAPAGQSETLRRKLAKRRAFVPWGSDRPFPTFRSTAPALILEEIAAPTVGDAGDDGPPPGEPLCLWEEPEKKEAEEEVEGGAPAEGGDAATALALAASSSPRARIMVDPMLTRWLRPHQREGVAFMFECMTGIKGFEGRGCLLADDVSFSFFLFFFVSFRFFFSPEEEKTLTSEKTFSKKLKKNRWAWARPSRHSRSSGPCSTPATPYWAKTP